jgi:transposase-like protein
MSRTYSVEEKQRAVDRLIANFGDIGRTSAELDIPERTLWRWRKEIMPLPPPPLPPQTESSSSSLAGMLYSPDEKAVIPPDDLEALRDLKAEMLHLTKYIIQSDRIKPAIDAAPLHQRVTALTQLIDRIIKLAAQLALSEEEDVEILVYDKEETDEEETEVFTDEAASETAGDFE